MAVSKRRKARRGRLQFKLASIRTHSSSQSGKGGLWELIQATFDENHRIPQTITPPTSRPRKKQLLG